MKAPKVEASAETQNADGDLVVNTLVFAKWTEKTTVKYWPGKIKSILEDQRYMVAFFDGYEKDLKKEEILAANLLVPGNKVNIDVEDNLYQPGSICSFADCSSANAIFYTVALDSVPNLPEEGTRSVSHRGMHLSSEQWNEVRPELKSEPQMKVADVSLDNVICGKRRSKPLTPIKEKSSASTTTPRTPRRKRGGINVETSATETEESEKPMTEKKKQRKRVASKRLETLPATTDDDESTKSKKEAAVGAKSDLFKNFSFLITQGKHQNDEDFSALDTETENDEDDGETLREEVLNRVSLKKQILEHGGHVLARFPDKDKEKIPSNVSDKYYSSIFS